jgi:hypothetical protein
MSLSWEDFPNYNLSFASSEEAPTRALESAIQRQTWWYKVPLVGYWRVLVPEWSSTRSISILFWDSGDWRVYGFASRQQGTPGPVSQGLEFCNSLASAKVVQQSDQSFRADSFTVYQGLCGAPLPHYGIVRRNEGSGCRRSAMPLPYGCRCRVRGGLVLPAAVGLLR